MSSIMRARSALTGRGEGAEVIGGFLLELKVAGPSMLAIGCPDRHPLPLIHAPPSPKPHRPQRAESRESGFVHCPFPAINTSAASGIAAAFPRCELRPRRMGCECDDKVRRLRLGPFLI